MNKLICAIFVGVGLLVGIESAMADDLTDFSSLVRDVTPLSPGIDVISPYFILRDTDNNGIRDTFYVNLRVYKSGTNTPLVLQSNTRSTALPDIPCTNPQWSDVYIENVKFLGKTGSSRAHVAVELVAECQETGSLEYKEAYKTFVYSADLSTSMHPSVWSYVANRELEGFDIVKDDSGQETDIAILTTMYPIDPANNNAGHNMVVRTVNLIDGVLISECKYVLVRP